MRADNDHTYAEATFHEVPDTDMDEFSPLNDTLFWQSASEEHTQDNLNTSDSGNNDAFFSSDDDEQELYGVQDMTRVSAEEFRFYQEELATALSLQYETSKEYSFRVLREDEGDESTLNYSTCEKESEEEDPFVYSSFSPTVTTDSESETSPRDTISTTSNTQEELQQSSRSIKEWTQPAKELDNYDSDEDSLGSLDTEYTPPGISPPSSSLSLQTALAANTTSDFNDNGNDDDESSLPFDQRQSFINHQEEHQLSPLELIPLEHELAGEQKVNQEPVDQQDTEQESVDQEKPFDERSELPFDCSSIPAPQESQPQLPEQSKPPVKAKKTHFKVERADEQIIKSTHNRNKSTGTLSYTTISSCASRESHDSETLSDTIHTRNFSECSTKYEEVQEAVQQAQQKREQQLTPKRSKMPYSIMQCDQDGAESYQGSVMGQWHSQCESLLLNPFCFLDLWEPYDTKRQKGDDETLATYDDESSYEDEGYVNILVAVQVCVWYCCYLRLLGYRYAKSCQSIILCSISYHKQATVLGADFPETLNPPTKNTPYVWGTNFVGMVQPPKGNAVHSRKFPPGSRVASISAWSASSHKPYLMCNSSHLLPVPPLDGLHLDGTEVAVIAAAYLPAFQALHHGQREHKHLACEPTALEGQRILILAHSIHESDAMKRSLVDSQVQAAVRMALWAGACDVHVSLQKAGNAKRNIFGNDYRVRLLDTPPSDWVPMLQDRIDVILDFTDGFSILGGEESTMDTVEAVQGPKGRYVGFLGEDCCGSVLDCREEGPKKKQSWTDSLTECANPAFLPNGRDIRHVVEWTAMCIRMKRASLFDFYSSWKQEKRLAEHDFRFLLELLAKRQIRPHVSNILDLNDFPAYGSVNHPSPSRSMTGAIVCEPWSSFRDTDDLSCCSDLSK